MDRRHGQEDRAASAEEPPMPRANRPRWSGRAGLGLTVLVLGVAAGGSFALVKARASSDPPDGPRDSRSAEAVAHAAAKAGVSGGEPQALEGSGPRDDHPRPSRSLLPRRSSRTAWAESSDGWYLGMAGVAVVLALGGGIAAAARRFAPRSGAGALQVVSRVNLSPKHAVYLLRAGGRVLLVGTGPHGAPTLISELDSVQEIQAASGEGEEA
jgi:Flagellar biosynthesis protein, FliO